MTLSRKWMRSAFQKIGKPDELDRLANLSEASEVVNGPESELVGFFTKSHGWPFVFAAAGVSDEMRWIPL